MRALAARLMRARAPGHELRRDRPGSWQDAGAARQLVAFRACLATYSALITINVSSRRARAADEQQEQATGEETGRWHDFGAWLAQKRVDLGYTQAHVANQADISTQSLVSLEHGGFRRYADGPWILPNPRDDTLVSLARLFVVKAEEMFKRVGRYADRPQTKTSLRRRGRASSRQPARGDRIAELEARLEEDLRRTRERTQELEERQRLMEEALRKAGIPLDGASLAVPERSRRRRAAG